MKNSISRSTYLGLLALWGLAALPTAWGETEPKSGTLLQAGDFVALCGDSITAQKLYSLYIEEYLVLCRPEAGLELQQFGWGGEKAPSFLERMNNDVTPFGPEVATLCYGMNDGEYKAVTPQVLEKYREALTGIVAELRKAGVRRIILGTPGAVDTDSFRKLDPQIYNNTLKELGEVAQELAQQEGLDFADVHTPMLEVMAKAKAKYGDRYYVAGSDGVHPNRNGQLVMAYAFLKALGVDGEIGTITLDVNSGAAEATEGHRVLQAGSDFVEVESSRYPFCFSGKPEAHDGNLGITEFLPFNQELNRFRLVIHHAPPSGVRVTWGEVSRDFTAEEATAGINLAAEFLQTNPFSRPFAEAETKIREKQFAESPLSKELLHSLSAWNQTFPEKAAVFQELRHDVLARAADLRRQSGQVMVPVTHRITVTPLPVGAP